MATLEVSRTLVKSPPELWEELRGERLIETVGCTQVNVTEDERKLEWEADGTRGAAVLEPAGWGTKLTLTAELPDEQLATLEPEVAKLGLWARLRGVKPPPPPEPTEPAAPPRGEELQRAFEQLLDDLGSAHRKPFQLG